MLHSGLNISYDTLTINFVEFEDPATGSSLAQPHPLGHSPQKHRLLGEVKPRDTRKLISSWLCMLSVWFMCVQVHSLSDVEQQQLEADQAAAVEREDFEAAAAIDEQLQVW